MTDKRENTMTSRRAFLKTAGAAAASAATFASVGTPAFAASNSKGVADEGQIAITTPQKGPYRYEHQSDFSVITIGTGCPEPVIGRSGPCTLVQYKGNYFLVDVGDGATMRLCEKGIPLAAIKNVLFTHHHADHNEGYTKWLINSWMTGRKSLDLVGPPHTKQFHEMLLNFYDEDLKYRATLQGLPLDAMYNAKIQEFEGANKFKLDGVNISTGELTHTMYNLGYRFEVDGKSIVVSGDTSFDEDLITLAKDADVLVMDSGFLSENYGLIATSMPMAKGEVKKAKPKPQKKDTKNHDKTSVLPHPGPGELAAMSIAANVKKLVVTHYPPFLIDEDATRADLVKAGFKGEVIFAKDLLEIIA